MASVFPGNGGEPISSKTSKLNQLLQGKLPTTAEKCTITREGLVDALLVLYEQCSKSVLMKNENIATFVKKYSGTVSELKKLRISISDFEIKNVIGRGHFGEVEVVREKYGGDVYALKVLRKLDMLSQQSVAFYEEERDIMARTTSPWVTQLHYAFQDNNNLYLVMDFHPGGDLLSLLGRYEDMFEESMARFYLAEMVQAIHALHAMGYVHRDIKPENILIDRTGHIKLADFGSACRLNDINSSVSNMPVGTPDYLSPEVLEKMNSSDTCGKFDEGCDWWSLGICMFEMLFGHTPFSDQAGSMVTTYASIMNYKKTLAIPQDVEVSDCAKSLIKEVLTGHTHRLKYDKICAHAFFRETDFDNIRHTVPPFIPTITSSDDTSNFEEFDKAKPPPKVADVGSSGFSGKDLPFVGFTFTKALSGTDRHSASQEVSTPACKASLERRLNTKTKELQELREKYKTVEHSEAMMKAELDLLKRRVTEKENCAKKAEAERDALERSIAKYITANKSLQRSLDHELQERSTMDSKAMKLLEEITQQAKMAQKLKEETLGDEVEECRGMIEQLEEEKMDLEKRLMTLKKEIRDEKNKSDAKDKIVSDLQTSLNKYRDSSRTKSQEVATALESREADFKIKETELNLKLDQAVRQNKEASEMLKELRDSKTELEEEIFQLRLSKDMHDNLKKRLSAVEDRRKSLESQMHKIILLEQRESALMEELDRRTTELKQLEQRILELESICERRERDYKKCERLYTQRESQLTYKIKDLETELDKVREDRVGIEEQSILVFEENEDRLRTIQEHESTIALLKGNVQLLEDQIDIMKVDIENEVIKGTPRYRTPRRSARRSGVCQTDTPTAAKKTSQSGSVQTDNLLSVTGAQTQTSFCLVDSMTSPAVHNSSRRMQGHHQSILRDVFEEDEDTSGNRGRKHATIETQTDPKSTGRSGSVETSNAECVSESSSRIRTEVRICQDDDDSASTEDTDTSKDRTDVTVKVKVTQKRSKSVERDGDGKSPKKRKSDPPAPEDWEEEDSVTEIDEDEEQMIRELEDEGKEYEDCKMKKNVKTWRQVRRHLERELSDMEQQKLYLELKVDTLTKEVDTFKDSTHQQRIRALDLKCELRDKTNEFEKQLSELKEKLAAAEMSLSEAKEAVSELSQRETSLKGRLAKSQQELDSLRISSVRETSSLKETKNVLESRVKTLERKYKLAEDSEKEAKENAYKFEKELRENKLKVAELSPKCSELEKKLRFALEEKARFKIEAASTKDDLQTRARQCDVLQQNVTQLKALCSELEGQITDFEKLNCNYEEKQNKWSKQKHTYEKAVDERETEIDQIHKHLATEKQNRQRLEAMQQKNKQLQQSSEKAFKAEIEHLKQRNSEQKIRIDTLNNQLGQLEHSFSMLEVDYKGTKRRVEVAEQENIKLKEEISKHITKLSELKGSNFKLSKNLEDAMEKYEILANHRTDLENQLETVQACHNHEKYKLESTIAQQTKLIEYLQNKVENPPKKKRGLFGSRKDQPSTSIQFRELQHTLDHERERNSALRQEVMKLKDELYSIRTETNRLKTQRSTENVGEADRKSQCSNPALTVLSMSPTAQPSPGAPLYPTLPKHTSGTTPRRPKQERMHHNIPHKFMSGLNSRATKCAVCLGSVLFVKQASKCQECNIVCHPKCVPDLPASCGLPTEYARHFTDMMSRTKTANDTKVSVAHLNLEMDGWMKMPKSGKQVWERKFVVLKKNRLYIHTTDDPNADPVDEFDLCPKNGDVTIHSAVTAADLNTTAPQDMPYILRMEFEPHTTCWPGRVLYVMALSFPEKQKWVATLEAIVNHSSKDDKLRDGKVLGNPMFKSHGSNRLEVNCSLPLSENMILLGADEGLFSMQLENTPDSRPLSKLHGIEAVHMLELVPGLGLIAAVTGKERDVVLLEVRAIQQCMLRTSQTSLHSKPTLRSQPVDGANGCTTFAVSSQSDGVYACVATADRLLIYKYNNRRELFMLKKELVTAEACSCMTFCQDFIIVGTDRFYAINLHDYGLTTFLDQSDTSLAFAAFGAARYQSFPIAVLKVSPPSELEEFLLCFNEFGVFVHSSGRRSRSYNMKWSGLPLSFAFREPYLYVVYFNTLQVVEIRGPHEEQVKGGRKYLNIVNPRYLGPALMPSAVYIASLREADTEIICFKGNMSGGQDEQSTDDIKENAMDFGPKTSSSGLDDLSSEAFTSTDDQDDSPMRIRKMSNSPGRSQGRPRVATTSTESELSSESSFGRDQTNHTPHTRHAPRQREHAVNQSHHKTVVTLDRFLKEQSVIRAQAREQEVVSQNKTVKGLKNAFEHQRSVSGRRNQPPSTSSGEHDSTF